MNRDFTVKSGDKEIKLKIVDVTAGTRLESMKHYVRAQNEALANGYQLRAEVERTLRQRNLLDTAEDDKLQFELRKSIKNKEIELRTAVRAGRRMTKEEGRALALSIKADRIKMSEIGSGVSGSFNNTVESQASNEQIQYFVYACTVNADDGSSYWPSFEAFKADTENPAYNEAVKELLSSMMGIDKNQEAKLYENAWLIRMGFMNDKLQLINEKGQTVDNDGRLIDENGRYINSNGDFLDVYGNRVDKDGALMVEDGWGVTKPTEVAPPLAVADISK